MKIWRKCNENNEMKENEMTNNVNNENDNVIMSENINENEEIY